MKPDIVALDMDGTTLSETGDLTPATIAALHKASETMEVVIATGRPALSLQVLVIMLTSC